MVSATQQAIMEAVQKNLSQQYERVLSSEYVDLYRPYINTAKEHYIATFFAIWFLYRVHLTVYRLYFHPLRNFPGPKLAAVSTWYEFYYDYLRNPNGKLAMHVLDLHQQYGEIFRLGPNKLRINNLEAYDKIHAVGTKFYLSRFYDGFQIPKSVISQQDNESHRDRRKKMGPLFTKKEIVRLSPLVEKKTQMFLDRILRNCAKEGANGQVIFDAHHEVQAIASDIIMEFSFGHSFNILEQEDQHHPMVQAMDKAILTFPFGKYAPWFGAVIQGFPDSFNEWLLPGSTALNRAGRELYKELQVLFKKKEQGTFKKDPNAPLTVFYELLDSYTDVEALVQDSTLSYSAGIDTITQYISCATYYLGLHKDIQDRLFEELKTIWPDKAVKPSLVELEALPYLAAFVKENRRLSYGVCGALPRVCPHGGTELAGQYIPGGTICETASYSIHHHPIFGPLSESFKFNPERWLDPSSRAIEKYIVNFGSGSRTCLGMHLAMLQIYTVIPTLIRNFEVDLGEELREGGLEWTDRWMMMRRAERWDVVLTRRDE